jgi:hypothetical protein
MRLSHPLHPSLSSSLLVLSLKHGCPSSPPAVVRAVRVHGALPAVLLGLHSAEHAAVVGYGGRRLAAAVGGPVAGLHGGTRLARATSGNRWVRAAQRWIPHMQATGTANRTAHTLQCPRLDRVARSAAAVRGGHCHCLLREVAALVLLVGWAGGCRTTVRRCGGLKG